jgi:putative membrane protein
VFSNRFRLSLFLACAGILLLVSPVLAHDGEPHGPAAWWLAWSFEPGVVLALGLTAVVYIRGRWVMVRRAGGANRRLRSQTWAFIAGMVALAIALFSPIDVLAGQLFWVHMIQHSLLILAAAPLLALAYPLPALMLGLPSGLQRLLGKSWRRVGALRAAWGILSGPIAAWLLQTLLLWTWHAPALYQASVENDAIHALQHFSFLGSALLFWWVVFHTFGIQPAKRGVAVLYLFTAMLQSGLLGALLTFSTHLWYPVYAGRSENWGFTALSDQQLAGTIMWIPAGMVYLGTALWMMKTWLDAMDAREDRALRKGN